MDILSAILLGILQGLTEFLPVSSTAHLTLAGKALGLVDPDDPAAWTAFLAVVQIGTLAAVLLYFRSDLSRLARAVAAGAARRLRRAPLDEATRRDERLAWLLALATVPIVVVGLALRDVIEGDLTKNLYVIAASLVLLALVLALAERVGARRTGLDEVRLGQALLIGGAQVLSLVPGASRSGTTLAGGLFAGLDRTSAARFSFLLSVPAIGGSALFEAPAALRSDAIPWTSLLAATLVAAAAGLATIHGLLAYLQRRSTAVFVWYRLALGAGILLLLALGVVEPL